MMENKVYPKRIKEECLLIIFDKLDYRDIVFD
jgi:hypothetical protein